MSENTLGQKLLLMQTSILVAITYRIPAGTPSSWWAVMRCLLEVNACQGQSGLEKSLQCHSALLIGIFQNECEWDLSPNVLAALQGYNILTVILFYFFLSLVWFCIVCMHESPKGSMETDDIDANVNTGQTTNLSLLTAVWSVHTTWFIFSCASGRHGGSKAE